MEMIRHNVTIKTTPQVIFKALTHEEGLKSWWAKNTVAKAEVGFVNVFTFGKFRNEIKVTELVPDKKVRWECTDSIPEWIGTTVSFDLEANGEKVLLRFNHSGWKQADDVFARSNYDWAQFLHSLKMLCETGTGAPH
jgi:uncharacterized protein YndB with AHSA1/START domain